MAMLAETRKLGYSLTDRACHPRAIALGAPIFDYAHQPIAAIALTVDVDEFTLASGHQALIFHHRCREDRQGYFPGLSTLDLDPQSKRSMS